MIPVNRATGNTSLIDATLNSLFVAFLAATAATLLGTLTALALHRYRFTGRKFLQSSLFVLMVSPDIVMGVSLLILFLGLGLKPGFCTLLLAHIAICLPFVTATVYARLLGFDEHLVEAAQDLGASEAQAFRYIIFPLLIPGIVAGWLLSFTLSMDDVIVSFFTTGPGFEILPLQIYSMVRLGVKPDVNALSALMICVTSICVLTAQILIRRKK